jgi:DNA-binding SARP family transcriptional activator
MASRFSNMSHLRLHVLGGLAVTDGAAGAVPVPASCHAILGYLITNRRRRVSRTELAETLWFHKGGDQARRCLSTALWRLKRSTGSSPPLLSFRSGDEVSLNWDGPIWVDSVALELRLTRLLRVEPGDLPDAQIRRLQRGLGLYRGDYLHGLDDDWAAPERQRLRNIYVDGLYHLSAAYAAAFKWADALEWGRRANHEEPLREDVHRLLMLAYARNGNRAKAAAQYWQCERVLDSELGVAPMPETQELHRQLLLSPPSGTTVALTGESRLPSMVDGARPSAKLGTASA